MKRACYFYLVLIAFSCKSSDSNLYEFDPRTIKGSEFTLSEIADDISYIPFDNIFPLGWFSKTALIRDAIYLSSRNYGILRFDRNGKFINKIGSLGRGPGEYTSSMHFSVDDKTGRVYNISSRNNYIQVYSKNGQFIRSFLLKHYGTSISNTLFFNNNLFTQCEIEFEDESYEWIIYDTLGNIIKEKNRHLPKFYNNSFGAGHPYIYDGKLNYYNSRTDTIFSVLSDFTEIPLMILSPGEHRFPRAIVTIEQILQHKYFTLSLFFETKRFFVIKYCYQKYGIVLIDKQSRETLFINFEWDEGIDGNPISGIVNDIDGGSWFLPDSYFEEDGREYLVGLQYPYMIKTRLTSDEFRNSKPKYPEKKKEFEKFASSLKETDNPVLVLVRLKK
jgi:hypothetical protein